MVGNRKIWMLLGKHAGDNEQLRELASRLDGEVSLKSLTFNRWRRLPVWIIGKSLASLRPEARRQLTEPWPDLVIAAGRSSAPAALWIKAASGGRTRLVQLGRPRARLDDFDLVITTPQYGLPPGGNIVELKLPLAVPKSVAPAEIEGWLAAWESLPRPLIVVVIGAARPPLSLGTSELRQLGQQASDVARAQGGSLLIIMSPRSEANAHGHVLSQVSVPCRCYPWRAGGENPYQAALALADRFAVTSDSASMLSEVVSTGKPVMVFLLPVSRFHFAWKAQSGLVAWLVRRGLLKPPRNVGRIFAELLRGGHVTLLGSGQTSTNPFQRNDDEAVARVRNILAGG